MTELYNILTEQSRAQKRAIVLVLDLLIIPISLWLAYALRAGGGPSLEETLNAWNIYMFFLSLAFAFIILFGIHNIKMNAFDIGGIFKIAAYSFSFILAGLLVAPIFTLPREVVCILGAFVLIFSVGARLIGQSFLNWLWVRHYGCDVVVVYGAGSAGVQLISALKTSKQFEPVAVVDDDVNLLGVMVSDLPVQSPKNLDALVRDKGVKYVLLAMPSVPLRRQKEIVQDLSSLSCKVKTLPSYVDLIHSQGIVESLRPISPTDLLERDRVDLDVIDVEKTYTNNSVIITGAGGSIGSELARQAFACNPKRIVLFEQNEYALYMIDRELQALVAGTDIEVVAVLGSVCDRVLVAEILTKYEIKVVLHAAAYKHVPLVEENEIEGLRNNVKGTRIVAQESAKAGVARFILISTDKAVRPTNVMGATKRLAEMVIQNQQKKPGNTLYSMVRFGNVLGSSGSVIPLFRSQIAQGGPVTLTHSDIVRYFMTIPEAARLVLLAGSYAEGGDLFILDMGQPVKIMDLALRMVKLSGLTVRNEDNPDGDIAIKITGLRRGEKLFEELLIGEGVLNTPHKKILRAKESVPTPKEMETLLKKIDNIIEDRDSTAARTLIETHVEGYHHEHQA